MSQKAKMCKSPKSIVYSDKIEYEHMNTNCTIVGSNNLHLVKKPQIVTSMSPAYSNPSPGGYLPPSPYSSPASMKSPSPQGMKPPTPQPNTFPVMQIIHNSHPVIARPIHTSQPQNVIKLKPPLNILPKPSASPQQSPKPSVSPQIVLPSNQQATIMPTAQPLLLNQMPMLAPGVQFILRPQTKIPTQMQQTPQGLILQQGGQQLLQLQPQRSQQMMRVLTNGVPLPTTTYVTQMAPQNNMQQQAQTTPPKKKPNKKKKQKLDLANIMKLSGIGDDDDVQFESDASQSESEHNAHSQPATPQPTTPTMVQPNAQVQVQQSQNSMMQSGGMVQQNDQKGGPKMNNIQISAMPQTISAAGTPLVQVLNQSFQGGGQPQQQQPQGIPFNPFITPNFTINNGLMVQRSGGFKLALGEDGRLVLQHDPTLNQDINSQLLLQSLFGLNGGLVLQPSIDQQIHSQTVQTIQQQSVQTIQQQTVQSQTIQTVQHQIVQPQTLQSIQSQLQGQIQSLLQQQNMGSQSIAIQPQNITLQPQGLQSIQVSQPLSIHQPIAIQSQSQPITIQAQSQPITIQSQSQPITIQSQASNHQQHHHHHHHHQHMNSISQQLQQNSQPMQMQSQSQIINLSQANQIYNNQSNMMQVSQPQTTSATTQSQQPLVQHHFTQSGNPGVTLSQGNLGNQPVLKVQPFQKSQPPVQTVHPIHHHSNQQTPQPPPASYVVNLTPDQLEQLKRNGQLTVNGQTIFMQRPKTEDKKTSPKIKPIKKSVSKIPTVVKENKMLVNNLEKTINNVVKESVKPMVCLQSPSPQQKMIAPPVVTTQSVHTQVNTVKAQPSAIIQPQQAQPKIQIAQPKVHVPPSIQPAAPQQQQHPPPDPPGPPNNQEVERFLGQLIEETQPPAPPPPVVTTRPTPPVLPAAPPPPPAPVPAAVPPTSAPPPPPPNNIVITSSAPIPANPTQRVHTIQLTPQKQQHLKSIQLQIQTLSARLTPGNTEMQNALKLLFQEQQKILASGKLLPPDKVFYHNNQLIVNNSVAGLVKNEVLAAGQSRPIVTSAATNGPLETTVTASVPNQTIVTPHPIQQPPKIAPVVTTETCVQNVVPPVQKIIPAAAALPAPVVTQQQPPPPQPPPPAPSRFIPLYTKAQLIEQQLNTDQNGAVKPDVQTPFKDKADACKRLIRYHCFEQPVLSQKDLNKADEIFELTARHFIDKFGRMADKYRFLLHKESQRHVQTSELMMLDRMFLAEEQQSLIKLRQEMEDSNNLEMQQAMEPAAQESNDEYDEWACIQRELGCLPPPTSDENAAKSVTTSSTTSTVSTTTTTTTSSPLSVKRSCNSDTRLDTLKKFRVDKQNSKKCDEMKSSRQQPHFVQSTSSNVLMSSSIVQSTNYHNTTQQQSNRIMNGPSCTVTSNRTITNTVPLHNSLHSYNSTMHIQNPMQRVHGMHNIHPLQHVVHNSTLQRNVHNMQHYSTQHIVQHITHTVHHTQQIQHGGNTSVHHSSSVHSQNSYSSGNEELDNNDSIDEQVQSAIDSILNLQQSTGTLELDETMQNMLS